MNDINMLRYKAAILGFEFDSGEFFDPYRIVLNCENSGEQLYYFLVEKNIFCEFYTDDSVIIIPSIANETEDFDKLFVALNDFAKNNKIMPVKSEKHNFYPPGFE